MFLIRDDSKNGLSIDPKPRNRLQFRAAVINISDKTNPFSFRL